MTRRVVAIVVALMLFVALPFVSSAASVEEVVLPFNQIQGSFYNSSGSAITTYVNDSADYRKFSSSVASAKDVVFKIENADGSALFDVPPESFVIWFDFICNRAMSNVPVDTVLWVDMDVSGSLGSKTFTAAGIPSSITFPTPYDNYLQYRIVYDDENEPDLFKYDTVQKITMRFTFLSTAQATEILMHDILTERAYNVLIDGDGTPLAPDKNEDLDNAGEQMGNLENDALGGKTDEEIANDVNSALSFDVGTLDADAQAGVSGFFDGLLVCFGADYQSLMMLALSLGLAAFIIGRRYKTG